MTTTKPAGSHSPTLYSDAAKIHAGNLGDECGAMGVAINLRHVAEAYDAGAASAVNSHAELVSALRMAHADLDLAGINGLTPQDAARTARRLASILAKHSGA